MAFVLSRQRSPRTSVSHARRAPSRRRAARTSTALFGDIPVHPRVTREHPRLAGGIKFGKLLVAGSVVGVGVSIRPAVNNHGQR
jgi:hypothetical protein